MQPAVSLAPRVPVVPPFPEPAPEDASDFELAAVMRTNGLRMWPERAYEEDVTLRRFFGRSTYLFNGADAIKRVLVDNYDNYTRTRAAIRVLKPLLGDGLLISQGASWRHQRRTLAPAFTPRAVGLLVPHIVSATDEAIADLGTRNLDGFDLLGAIQRLTLEIAGRTMFSLEMRDNGPRLRDFLARYNTRLARPHLLDLLLPLKLPTPHDLGRWWFRRAWVRFVDELLESRRRSGADASAPRDLLDLMTAARDPETGRAFSPSELRDQTATMILAGHETTAVALFWAVYLLARAPEVQDCVAAEAAARPGEAPALERLPYTRAVIDETMRLYPPAYVVVRVARAADTVGGVSLKAGEVAVVSPWVLHRHRRRWLDPNAFEPERFLPGAQPVDRFAYLPFGAGPRVCIGAQFAVTEATLVLARLVRAFRIELADARPVVPMAVVTTHPDHPPAFRLRPR